MGRAISNKNVLTAKFEVAEFDGAFLASFGKPELRGAWIIYGGSGSGKTSFVMQVCKYLTRFRRVAYDSLEQGLSLSLKGMGARGHGRSGQPHHPAQQGEPERLAAASCEEAKPGRGGR